KFTKPRYVGLQRGEIPAIATPDGKATVHLIAGEWSGHKGPIESLTGVFMSTVELAAGGRVSFPGVKERNVFLYIVRGRVAIAGVEAPEHSLAELDREGDIVEIEAAGAATLVFGHAQALDEAVVAHGPFVMNTEREIHEAIADYQAGKFGPLG
ncbi:MAG TPA: pirin-like C-terminal cupin domain-containing protein, partial [Usitatibacter sp.]